MMENVDKFVGREISFMETLFHKLRISHSFEQCAIFGTEFTSVK